MCISKREEPEMTKTPTTRNKVQAGDSIDGIEITKVKHDDNGNTALKFRGEPWGPMLPGEWHVSVWR
jgi:hypothetical protein